MKYRTFTSHLSLLAVTALVSTTATDALASGKITSISGTDSTGDPVAAYDGTPLANGAVAYLDRTHTYVGVPSILEGADYIMTRNSDKSQQNYSLSFKLQVPGILYLLIDNRVGDNVGGTDPGAGTDSAPLLGNGIMDWVMAMGFTDTGFDIGIDEGNDGSLNQTSSIFSKIADAGNYTFGTQNDTSTGGPGGRNMYAVACAPIPEPGLLALISIGACGLLLIGQSRRS